MSFVRAYIEVLRRALRQEHPLHLWSIRPIWKVEDDRTLGARVRDRVFSTAVLMLQFVPASDFWLRGGLAVAGAGLSLLLLTLPVYVPAALREMTA